MTRESSLVRSDSRTALAARRARSFADATLAGFVGHRDGFDDWLPPMSFRHAARDVDAHQLLRIVRAERPRRGQIDVAVLVHGLFVDEQNWTLGPDPLGDRLQDEFGWTPLVVRFNTGQHISENGEALADLIIELYEEWGQELGTIQFIGHSMGGLVARSALSTLEARQASVLNRVERLFLLATPNQGADLERVGHTVEMALRHVQRLPSYGLRLLGGSQESEENSAFARVQNVAALPLRSVRGLIGLRSDGIRDMRYGYMQRREWEMDTVWHDRALVSHKRPLPPPLGVRTYSIAGSLWPRAAETPSRWRNDGLVSVASAAGKGGDFDDIQVIENNRFVEIPLLLHQLLPTSERVRGQMARWIAGE